MTNTKFRKRALLSSVAMLLVALVALGSATFAWFVANPTATASGLAVKAKAAPGIAIASGTLLTVKGDSENYTDAYKETTILRVDQSSTSFASAVADSSDLTLNPASPKLTLATSSNDVNFGTITAKEAAGKTAGDDQKFIAADTEAFRYNEKIYLKTSTGGATDTATAKSVAVTIRLNSTNNTCKNGVKVVLTSSTNELIGVWKPSSGDSSATWSGNTTGTYKVSGAVNDDLWDDAPTYTASGSFKALPTDITLSSAMNNDGTTNNYINVYVYLDGENDGVFSNNVPTLTALVDSIDVSVSTNAA